MAALCSWIAIRTPVAKLRQSYRYPALISRATDGNYSSGRFKLILQEDGNLVLYPLERDDQPQGVYWSSDPSESGSNPMILNVDQNGMLSLVNATNATVKIVNDNTGEGQHFHRVTLESNGVLREYARKRDDKNPWSVLWQVPEDPCAVKSSIRAAAAVGGYRDRGEAIGEDGFGRCVVYSGRSIPEAFYEEGCADA